jgi:putative tricarboxylic transport membrane protein
MHRIYQVAALFFIAIAGWIAWESWSLEYYSSLGPGPGFFPFWLSISFGGLSLVWLFQESQPAGKSSERTLLPDRAGATRIIYILASLTVVGSVMNIVGYQLTMFACLSFVLIVLGRQKILTTLIIACAGSVGLYHLFGRYLDLHFPAASVAILARLGL